MDKLTQDEKAFLAQFEDNFTRAIDADYVRGAALSDMERMVTIWERITGKAYRLNTSCGHCILEFFKLIGTEYRKQKEEEEKPATKTKK